MCRLPNTGTIGPKKFQKMPEIKYLLQQYTVIQALRSGGSVNHWDSADPTCPLTLREQPARIRAKAPINPTYPAFIRSGWKHANRRF